MNDTDLTLMDTILSETDAVMPTTHQKPSPGSLNDFIARGHRLYVPPLDWTKLHLQLLNISFIEIANCKREHQHLNDQLSTWDRYQEISDHLQCFGAGKPRQDVFDAVQNLILKMPEALFRPDRPLSIARYQQLSFFFDGKELVEAELLANVIYENTQTKDMVLACVEQVTVQSMRLRRFSRGPRMDSCPIWNRILALRCKKITPPDPEKDPYFAGLLISLAQYQWLQEGENSTPMTYKVNLFVSMESEEYVRGLYLLRSLGIIHYFASVCTSFLLKFEFPNKNFDSSLKIKYTRIRLDGPGFLARALRHIVIEKKSPESMVVGVTKRKRDSSEAGETEC